MYYICMRTMNQYRAMQRNAMTRMRNSTDPRDIENYQICMSEAAAEGVTMPRPRQSVTVNTGRYFVEFVNPTTGETYKKMFVATSKVAAKRAAVNVVRELAAEVRAAGVELPFVQSYTLVVEKNTVSN